MREKVASGALKEACNREGAKLTELINAPHKKINERKRFISRLVYQEKDIQDRLVGNEKTF
jgi:hypothetical protein